MADVTSRIDSQDSIISQVVWINAGLLEPELAVATTYIHNDSWQLYMSVYIIHT